MNREQKLARVMVFLTFVFMIFFNTIVKLYDFCLSSVNRYNKILTIAKFPKIKGNQ
ncbi:hypothetical protein M899_0779 [Bacteriovorax sp. BSW11_IV]|nr:hypothetical protein M899_0779 [Bacteriovorax sp. BSW11_IV]